MQKHSLKNNRTIQNSPGTREYLHLYSSGYQQISQKDFEATLESGEPRKQEDRRTSKSTVTNPEPPVDYWFSTFLML